MIAAIHAAVGLAAALIAWRALSQDWVASSAPPEAVDTVRLVVPLASVYASALAVTLRRFRDDALSILAMFVSIGILSIGPLSRDGVGVVLMLVVALRFAPVVVALVREESASWRYFAAAFGVYTCLAAWFAVSVAPYGDQVHYLLAADRIGEGSLDATFNASLFRDLVNSVPTIDDVSPHVVQAPTGPRTVQGYGMPLLLAPGWLLGERVGAGMVMALFGAWTSMQTMLLLRDTIREPRWCGPVWAMTSFLPPLLPFAALLYPNIVGAAVIVTAYRLLFTRAVLHPALGAALLGTTFFLTPRDAIAMVALLLFARTRRTIAAVAAMLVLSIVANALIYGIPVPYTGYFYGTAAAIEVSGEPSINFRAWIGLPAILFDGTFGLAGSGPWVFLALLGAAVGWRDRLLRPAAVAVVATLLALSTFRYWEGGFAPPSRYLVDVLPLAVPLVALGLAAGPRLVVRAVAVLFVALSVVNALIFAALPGRSMNDAFRRQHQDVLDAMLGLNPLAWLPSFQPVTTDWAIHAYSRLIPALLIAGALFWIGRRRLDSRPP